MMWLIFGAIICLLCYITGYVLGRAITLDKLRSTRGEMGLETDEGCYGCKDVGLPCDPKCKFNSITDYEEVKEDEQSEKNSNQEN